jgi:hypothetical protein
MQRPTRGDAMAFNIDTPTLEQIVLIDRKLVSEGKIEFEGETIHHTWHRDGKLPNGQHNHYVEAHCDEPLEIFDDGFGRVYHWFAEI